MEIKQDFAFKNDQDLIDAMAYCYNDILTTQQCAQQYNLYIRGLYSKPSGNPNLLENLKLGIEKVIFNNPATIVLWTDGSKTVVKCSEDELFDPEKGLAMAICKKVLGDQFKKTFKEWIPKEYSEPMTISGAIEALRNIGNIFK